MGREFEVKLRVPEEKILRSVLADPQVAAFAQGKPREIVMESVYYDTPGGELSARRWTLRRRRENERYVVTVKTPAPGRARGEWETEAADVLAAVPLLCAMGAPEELKSLTAGGIAPRCGAEFTRTALDLLLPDGTRAELAADRGVLTGGSRAEKFAEVELELKAGSEETVEEFCRDLCRRYGLSEEKKSKFARASALAEGE